MRNLRQLKTIEIEVFCIFILFFFSLNFPEQRKKNKMCYNKYIEPSGPINLEEKKKNKKKKKKKR